MEESANTPPPIYRTNPVWARCEIDAKELELLNKSGVYLGLRCAVDDKDLDLIARAEDSWFSSVSSRGNDTEG
jgi:hypothetical protein